MPACTRLPLSSSWNTTTHPHAPHTPHYHRRCATFLPGAACPTHYALPRLLRIFVVYAACVARGGAVPPCSNAPFRARLLRHTLHTRTPAHPPALPVPASTAVPTALYRAHLTCQRTYCSRGCPRYMRRLQHRCLPAAHWHHLTPACVPHTACRAPRRAHRTRTCRWNSYALPTVDCLRRHTAPAHLPHALLLAWFLLPDGKTSENNANVYARNTAGRTVFLPPPPNRAVMFFTDDTSVCTRYARTYLTRTQT